MKPVTSLILSTYPVKYVDPDGETTIINNSNHWIIIRGEEGEAHAVRPGETYDTEEHQGLKEIDGILMHDGSVYKTNNGNRDATFTVSESVEGGYQVTPDSKGNLVNFRGDAIKSLYNQSIFGRIFGQQEKSGMYRRGDDSDAGNSWWGPALDKTELVEEDINDASSWNNKLAEFRDRYPNGSNYD